jgi:phosphoglycolate phosphatase-like HAD superfamily hydrolase
MEAGRRAGVRTCAVRYGYGDHTGMAAFQPDFCIDDLRDLVV